MSDFPLAIELPTPLTPIEAFERIADCWSMPLLLESRLVRPGLGEFSFVAADPFETFVLAQPVFGTDPFGGLRNRMEQLGAVHCPELPPFQGGAAGLLCYDLGRCWERLPLPACDHLSIPAMVVGLYDWVLAWDHRRDRCWLISQGFPEIDEPSRKIRSEQRASRVLAQLAGGGCGANGDGERTARSGLDLSGAPSAASGPFAGRFPLAGHPGVQSSFDRAGYLHAVERVIEYIRAGDIFQANLSQHLFAPALESPLSLYRRLRETNPAPFAGYFAYGDWAVLSSSPERFVQLQEEVVRTRPIKGTRSRRHVPEADLYTRDELRESQKDQAENVMIVDLLRNDLSRVCRPGTIRVPELCTVEAYETVTHLVSEVVGHLQPGKSFWDVIAAAFPGGSITGAPKIRAMEVINELERAARGPYCGSMFYCGFDGWADSNILIRTLSCRNGYAQFPVGGGIVVGSDPASEYEETLHKAAGLLRAVEGRTDFKTGQPQDNS